MHKLEKLFNPQSIAIVGASAEEGKVGQVITKNITALGYAGEVFLVNPNRAEILGRKCYTSLMDIDEEVDLAIIAIPAKFVNSTIKESAGKIKNFAIISAGFSETNEEGKIREEELSKIAKEKNLNILGPNCLGFIIPRLRLNASFAGGMPDAGNISFISQSGALAVATMDNAKSQEIKFSNVISIGNKMQIDEADLLEYLDSDENTKIIGMYLEGIKNGPRFMETARKVSAHKPIVVLKAGRSEKTQKAIASHTGALAGSDLIMNALFEKTGILRADNFEDFYSLVNLISRTEIPENNKIAIITNAGGPGVLTADALEGKEIKLGDFSSETKRELSEFLPEESSVENPVDLLGDAMEDRYRKVLEIISREKEIGTLVCVLTPQDQTPVAKIAQVLIDFKKSSNRNVIAIFIGGNRVKESVITLEKNDIPNFSFPDQGINVLDKYYKWSRFKNKLVEKGSKSDSDRQEKVAAIVQKAKVAGRQALLFLEASQVLNLYGIKTIETKIINTGGQNISGTSFPVVMKVDSDKVLHKTDRQGVILDIRNKEDLVMALKKLASNFPGENLIIQPMVERQTELIIGIKQDATVRSILIYGLGGIYTEIFKMVNFLIPPLSLEDIKASLHQGNLGFLFKETRGQKPYNLDELAEILQKIAQLSQEAKEIRELDINPLLIYNDSREGLAIDVKILI
ncbi:MAG: hypothetical protein CO141_02845 [Candidatus Moranbacteria bacterium CG_4_9_14_3_um_filter_42_9]|nr:MAG: hypothetical protein CO141_02845 [Candidatus Moranbacteria bacterium CG_4_9_14_3_um_filter_42_9]